MTRAVSVHDAVMGGGGGNDAGRVRGVYSIHFLKYIDLTQQLNFCLNSFFSWTVACVS